MKYGAKYGYYTDNETGHILAGQRWYSPEMMRWLSRDPIGYEGGVNLYEYVGGDPVNYIDIDGTNRVRILIETVGGLRKWVWLKYKDLVKQTQRGKNPHIPDDPSLAKRVAKDAWGDVVCHSAHGGKSKHPHYQPKKRKGRKGHVSYAITPPLIVGAGELLNEFFNPLYGGELE